MLRWMYEVTKENRIRPKFFRINLEVVPIVDKIWLRYIIWFFHVMEIGDLKAVRVAMEINVKEVRERKTEEEKDQQNKERYKNNWL